MVWLHPPVWILYPKRVSGSHLNGRLHPCVLRRKTAESFVNFLFSARLIRIRITFQRKIPHVIERSHTMKFIKTGFAVGLLMALFCSTGYADKYDETKQMFIKAGLSNMFETAYGYALFPTIGKGGIVVGAAYGEGRVYERGKYIGDTSMTQATVGLQLGGTGFSQVVFFKDERSLNEFTSGNFEFGAEAQATAITASAKASANTAGSSVTASGTKNRAATDGGYYRGMATYTITKGGLMYEATIGGQKFSFTKR